jgi:putative ABC transport system permease protein
MPSLRSLRLALRTALRAPGFTAVAVLTLALGVGTTTSIFSVINGTMLNLLPWGDTDTIVSIDVHRPKHDPDLRDASQGQFLDWQRLARSYSGLAAIQFELAYLTDRDEPHMIAAPRVTPNALGVARVKPLHGRTFSEQDGRPGAEPVALISERMWTERYGRDPAIVGRELEVDGERTTIVGIIGSAQWFPDPGSGMVRPLRFVSEAPQRTEERLAVFGRLAPGVTLQQAQAELDLLAERLAQQYPATDADLGLSVELTRNLLLSPQSKAATVFLMGAVGFVLLIVCANLAGLLLARAAAREKEIATRAALGASRAQIVAQLLLECVVIALMALPLALFITWLCRAYMLSLVPPNVVYMDQVLRIDRRVLVFSVLTMAGTIILFGLYPALKASRFDLNTSLKSGGNRGGTGSGAQRVRSLLVVVQLGLAVSLLATAALFMQAFTRVQTVNAGFETSGAMVAEVSLPDARYREPDQIRAFQQRLSSALSDLPGGARAAVISNAPLGWDGLQREFHISGRETAGNEEMPRAQWSSASPDYFATLGLRMLAGRQFSATDTSSGAPVAIVTRAFADRYFPGETPVGKRIDLKRASGAGGFSTGVREIVGVVSDVKSFPGLDAPVDRPRIYEPFAQQPTPIFHVVVRAPSDVQATGSLLRQRIREIDPLLGVTQIETMDTRFERLIWQSTFFIRLMTVLGALALALAAVGVYGVVSYTTARRTREFGIRAALGAEPAQVAGLVLRKTLVLALGGAVLGVLLSLLLGRASQRVLYDSEGQDPATVFGVLVGMALVMFVATALPTLRATRVNPADCLRVE